MQRIVSRYAVLVKSLKSNMLSSASFQWETFRGSSAETHAKFGTGADPRIPLKMLTLATLHK